MAEQHPKTLGKYEVLSVIGRGGMGIVYKAKDPIIGRVVAVKTISATHHDTGGDDDVVQRFQMEAQSAGRLQHPNIATLYDFGTHEDTSYIVMEYVDGTDLARVIEDAVPLTLPQKVDIIIQVAHGLAYAHELGVVHRDMKPSNVRLSHKGEAKIIDFGLARFDSTRLTKTGFMSGTIAYMSPERIHGASGPSDDVFALGAIGWELLTYQRAFAGSTPPEVMMKIISASPAAPSAFQEVPPGLDAIVMKCLARDPAERYASAGEYAEALEDYRGTQEWRDFLDAHGLLPTTTRRGRSAAGNVVLPTAPGTVHASSAGTVPAATIVSDSDPRHAAPTAVTPLDGAPAPPTLIQQPGPTHAQPTLVEPHPAARRNWIWPAAAAVVVAAGIAAMFLARGEAPAPQPAPPASTSAASVTTAATGTIDATAPAAVAATPADPAAAEVEVQRRILASLTADVASLALDAGERNRLDEARRTAQLAESRFGERRFDESARLMTTAIDTLRGLRQEHLKRVTTRAAAPAVAAPVTRRTEVSAKPAPAAVTPTPAPPATETVRASAPPAAAPPVAKESPRISREDVQRQVTEFIARMEDAYESRDVAFFRRSDANFSDRTERAIRNSPSVRVEIKVSSVDVNGTDSARVAVVRTDTFASPSVPPGVQRLVYSLERSGDSWRIVAMQRQ